MRLVLSVLGGLGVMTNDVSNSIASYFKIGGVSHEGKGAERRRDALNASLQ